MTRNAEAIRKVADHIEAHPDQYLQAEYATRTDCGTAYCIAGTVGVQQGLQPARFNSEGRGSGCWVDPVTEERASIETLAESLLGLSQFESGALFDPYWKPADGMTVPEALRRFANGSCLLAVSDENVLARFGQPGTTLYAEYQKEIHVHA